MDIDPNDLLSTNVFISKPDLNPNVGIDSNEEFKKYYEKEIQRQNESKIQASIKKIELKDASYSEDTDDSNIINTNKFNKGSEGGENSGQVARFVREHKTLVSIDSRDRMKTLYPKPNKFRMFLGKTFNNVKKIEMVSLEFPNTDTVINTNNNKIYWRNQEDIDLDITTLNEGIRNYPVYSVTLRTGSYTSSTLQNEIVGKLNAVRRKQGTSSTGSLVIGDYHYFVANLDVDTDIVTFTSLTLKQVPNNGLSTSLGSGVITVSLPGHGFSTYDMVYIVGVKSVAGITASVLTGFHQITVINANLFTFEVTVKAADTTEGGGNTCKCGIKAPFQLLWGENSFTVAQNIGFPLENSSQLIKTNVSDIENYYQMTINLVEEHHFLRTYDYIGKNIQIGYLVGSAFVTFRTYSITDITGPNSILVNVPDNEVYQLLNNNVQASLLRFNNTNYNVISYEQYVVPSIILTTFTDHNYKLSDIGSTISLYETVDPRIINDVSYDGDYVLYAVPSNTELIIRGVVSDVNTHINPIYGTLPRKSPLTTWTVKIKELVKNFIQISGKYYSKVVTDVPHKLNVGDSVMFNNVVSAPILSNSYHITSVLDNKTFLFQQEFVSLDLNNINQGLAFIGTGLITVSYPSHNFNNIVNIENGTPFDTIVNEVTISNLPIVISTLNRHNLSVGEIVRLTGTNTTPNLDGGGYEVYAIHDNDTFSIIRKPTSFTPITVPTTVTGILGLSHDFYLYDVEDIGGIPKTLINGKKYTVREIIDENTFTFIINSAFATSTEMGGGENVYINSLLHGFNGIQTNTKRGVLNRVINLQGEDYCFLTCPQLDTMLNTGSVKNIFARISLDQPPGYVCFKFLSNPKHFNTIPLDKLTELDFSVTNYDGSLYDFNDLDYSFTLEITEVSDATKSFNVSSRRGITDTS
jgi:hypothetical protein